MGRGALKLKMKLLAEAAVREFESAKESILKMDGEFERIKRLLTSSPSASAAAASSRFEKTIPEPASTATTARSVAAAGAR